MNELLSLQGTIFLLMLAGLVLKKVGIVGEQGQKNMTDLVLNLILPCNIIRSFQIEFSWETMHSFGTILIVSICIQLGCMVLGKLLFGRMPRNNGNVCITERSAPTRDSWETPSRRACLVPRDLPLRPFI